VLALAAVAALLIAQHLKHEQPLVDSAIWQPSASTFDPRTTGASVSFRAHYADDVSVSIVSTQTGRAVATIARGYAVVPWHRTKRLPWNGRTTSGALVPAGRYVVDIHFDRLDRTTQLPQASFDVHYTPR
jgi:hypothetical protein